MKKLFVLLFINFLMLQTSGQLVTIPDAFFVSFLTQNYPQCMTGNQMDTSCAAIKSETTLNCYSRNISNLTGVEYFTSLQYLNCSNNQITFLPQLSSSLYSLIANDNQLTGINSFPNGINNMNLEMNNLTWLPQLPDSLYLLRCNRNQLTSLPNLPSKLRFIYCYDNQLSSLPNLPVNLLELYCDVNNITSMPALPALLKKLDCSVNQLSSLPTLPVSLNHLNCDFNQIVNLPILPDSLFTLSCSGNQILVINSLPPALVSLYCSNNLLNSLPSLPNTLSYLDCGYNSISFLPILPPAIRFLYCQNNALNYIQELPDSMNALVISNNTGINCLPVLKQINTLNFAGTSVACLPNYGNIGQSTPTITSVPLCDIFNINGCDFFWNISGNVYSDLNQNCIVDSNENFPVHIKVNLFRAGNLEQQVYTGSEGFYSFKTGLGTYNYFVDSTEYPVYITCPGSGFQTSILNVSDSTDTNMDFGLNCKPGFDVGVQSISRYGSPFVTGRITLTEIHAGDMTAPFGLNCATGISGTIIINFTGPVSFISTSTGALSPVVSGNSLTFQISDFGLIDFNSDFNLLFKTDTTAQAGDQVCVNVIVNPSSGDLNISNNNLSKCFTVVNSFDPNEKEVYPDGDIKYNQEWLTYTVHFQNTGTAPAQNVYILDTLDQNLIHSTFYYLSSSHDPFVQIIGNVVKFNFPLINLPDSINDEPNSHGYVQYKIKPAGGLAIGSTISNTANIYFDFNPPVVTNTVINTLTNTVGISDPDLISDISVFPNPAKIESNISFYLAKASDVKIELLDVYGSTIQSILDRYLQSGKQEIGILTGQLSSGIYHLKIVIGEMTLSRKIVVLKNN